MEQERMTAERLTYVECEFTKQIAKKLPPNVPT